MKNRGKKKFHRPFEGLGNRLKFCDLPDQPTGHAERNPPADKPLPDKDEQQLFLAAMAGTIVDHGFGSLWALIMFQLPREVWLSVLPLAPLERTLFSLGAAIIGTPLLIGLPKIGILVGQGMYAEYTEEEDFE